MLTADTIRQGLQCNNPSCPCHKSNGHLHCPVHDPGMTDTTPSLSVNSGDNGMVIAHCHNGCDQETLWREIKERFSPSNGHKNILIFPSGKGGNGATVPALTLEILAKAKGLQIDGERGLKAWGVAQVKQRSATVIRIPYHNQVGEEVTVRYRHALAGGNRFSYRKGDKAMLYGLSRLKEIREAGWCVLVEGESDCWTCWAHDIPALGIPGKSTWRSDWAGYLDGLTVYLWQEPDAPELPGKVGRDIPDLLVIKAPPGFKDVNQILVKGENVLSFLDALKARAIPVSDLFQAENTVKAKELGKGAQVVLQSPDPLNMVRQAILAQGYGGDVGQPLIVYLSATSRLLEMRHGSMPVHTLLLGQASAGKSYLLGSVLKLLPEETYVCIEAGSPRALIYGKAELRHKALIFSEADSLPAGEDNAAASAVRALLQEHRLSYHVTVRDPETGEYTVKEVLKDGPTVMVTTSTRRLGHQLDTRLFTLDVTDTPDKITEALLAQAQLELNGSTAPDEALIAYQGYLQLKAPWPVIIPFIRELAEEIGHRATAARIMRDFARLVSLVKSAAILRHQHRETKNGKLIAQIEDYAIIFDLVNSMYSATLTGASQGVRDLVHEIEAMLAAGEKISATTLATRLGINRGTVSRRLKAAIKRGWLINLESRNGYPMDLDLGECLPEPEGLPTPEKIHERFTVANQNLGATVSAMPQVIDTIYESDRRCTVAGATGNINAKPDDQEICFLRGEL